VVLCIEWTRPPAYAAVAQSALNKLKTARIHWVDLYTGPITWQIRDRAGLLSMIELLTRVHQTAIAVFADGQRYNASPTDPWTNSDHDPLSLIEPTTTAATPAAVAATTSTATPATSTDRR
jgi:hypothetical protein